jgi:hypothetical protein
MVRLEGLAELKMFSDLIGTRTRDLRLVACHIHHLRYRVSPVKWVGKEFYCLS